MSTVIKFKKSSEFESIKKISNQLLSDKEVRRIFQFLDHDILAYKVLDKDVNEYLDFDFRDLNDLDKTKNIYMRVQVLSNPTLLPVVRREEIPEFSKNNSTTSSSQVSNPSNVTIFPNENKSNKIFIKEESCILDNILQIEFSDHMMEDIGKVGEKIQDKRIVPVPNSNPNITITETYKFPLEEISQFPNLYSALDSNSLMMGNEDTLLRILCDSIKRQSSNYAISYENVIDSLFLHFPYLAESYGDLNKSKNVWKEKLNKKFAYKHRSLIINAKNQENRTFDDSCLPSPPKKTKLNTTCSTSSSERSSTGMSNLPYCDVQEEICSPSCKKKTPERDVQGKKDLSNARKYLPECFDEFINPLLQGKYYSLKIGKRMESALMHSIIEHLNEKQLILNCSSTEAKHMYNELREELIQKYPKLVTNIWDGKNSLAKTTKKHSHFVKRISSNRKILRCRKAKAAKTIQETTGLGSMEESYRALKIMTRKDKEFIDVPLHLRRSISIREMEFPEELPHYLHSKINLFTEIELRIGLTINEIKRNLTELIKLYTEDQGGRIVNFQEIEQLLHEKSFKVNQQGSFTLQEDLSFFLEDDDDFVYVEGKPHPQSGCSVVMNNGNLYLNDTTSFHHIEGHFSLKEAVIAGFGAFFIFDREYPERFAQYLGLLEIVIKPRTVNNHFPKSQHKSKLTALLKRLNIA